MRFSRSLSFLPALLVSCCGFSQRLVVDDFLDGSYHKTFTGPGNFTERVDQIDPFHTVGGSRQITFRVSSNPSGNPVKLDSGDGRFAVDWQGLVTQQLDFDYGLGPVKMDVDLSWLTSMEVSRASVPAYIYGTAYNFFLFDATGNSVNNTRFRGRPGEDIGFNRIDFRGDDDFDWTHVTSMKFQQEHSSEVSRIQGYRTFQIVAVPEPSTLLIVSGALLFARKRAKSNQCST